jgi:hypothetical protein
MKRSIFFCLLLVSSLSGFGQEVISGKSNPVYVNVGNDVKVADIVIAWVSPKLSESVADNNEINLEVGINAPSEILSIDFFVNDLPVGEDRGFRVVEKRASNFDKMLEKKLILAEGNNVIKIVVKTSTASAEDSRTIMFEKPVIASTQRRDYAVLFATDEYDEWGDLVNPVNDATTIAKELEDNYGFEIELVTNNTIDEILIKLREYATKSYMDGDQLFIFFAGHGQFDDVYKTGYIVGTNSKVSDPAKTSYLSHSVLRDVVDNIPSKHIFLAMDVCFGGTFDRTIARAGSRGQDAIYNEITQDEYVQRKLRFKTRRYMTSGGKEYVPDGRPGQHSPFARKFIEGLRSYGGLDNILTLSEIANFVSRISPEPRFDEFGTNEPGSDFVFVAK